MKKKFGVFLMLVLCMAALTGCGKNGGTDAAQSVSARDHVYRVEDMAFEEKEIVIDRLIKGGDQLYAYGYHWSEEENGGFWIDFCSLNEDGSVKEKSKILLGEEESLNTINADENGNVYAVKNIFRMEEDGAYRDDYCLMKYTSQGEELFCVDLNHMPELEAFNKEDYFYTGSMLLKDGFVYLDIMGQIVKFDADGNFVKVLEGAEGESFEGLLLYALENGKVAALSYEETGLYASYVDLETGVFSEKTKLPGVSYEYSIYPGSGYDLYLVNSYGVFGYNVGEETSTQLMSYIDSDLSIYNIYNLIPIKENEFFASYDGVDTMDSMIGRFVKVAPSEVKDKEVIVLACNNLDWDIRKAVLKFNKENENYRISIQDYASLYGSEMDYMASINRLNADIVSGRVPDIIVVNSYMPIESYISKGLIEDIRPYIEQDEELDMNNLMPNIIEAFSVDGKLYRLVPSYAISTMVAKASDVGEERGWTVQEAMDLIASKPEGTQFLTYVTRDTLLINGMSMAGSQFVDWENGTCNFDSEGFIQLLHFLALFPEEIDEGVYTDDFWMNYESMWREDQVIAQMISLTDFNSYNYMEEGTFGEKITMIGFPSSREDGSVIVPDMQLAMSAKSSKKEGAWEFMRYFLTDEYQSEITYGLPLSIKRMEELAEEATKVPTYTDENGREIESPDLYYINGMEVTIPPMTEEEVAKLKEQLYSITEVYTYDENLIQIVQEEAAPFFAGQKKAEDVAKIIQSRAQIYVNENR